MPRELVTIGDLRHGPATRSRLKRASYLRMMPTSMGAMGQTNPDFAPGVTADSAGSALQDAAATLLAYLDANGVPSEHTYEPNVEAFQTTWNADPGNAASNAKLSPDGGYGANVQAGLNVLTGGIAPPVNTGAGPLPAPSPSPKPAPSPTPSAGGSSIGIWLLIAGAAGVYLLTRKKRTTSVTVRRANPRRALARRAML